MSSSSMTSGVERSSGGYFCTVVENYREQVTNSIARCRTDNGRQACPGRHASQITYAPKNSVSTPHPPLSPNPLHHSSLYLSPPAHPLLNQISYSYPRGRQHIGDSSGVASVLGWR
ncbi:hypothetical protein EVAR_76436_1 [Eumeta japonica]|uniref:Uncharacterized protein n=1 Tax=Eumeta variegata TaxID=151549 RepID=A0A4C1T7Y1_EUMVA|nr:hypothetical protein EVAR_76436_1 [Eumeta japonica]